MATGAKKGAALPKRTRCNVQQSKGGCLTCKGRRKKCGEEKPVCLRCRRAGFHCEGYASDGLSTQQNSGPIVAASSVVGISPTLEPGEPLSSSTRVGFEMLINSSDVLQPWEALLPWFGRTSRAVNTALATLGATYQVRVAPQGVDPTLGTLGVSRQYRVAIVALRDAISKYPDDHAALFIAAVVLAAVEVLQNREAVALVHLQAAFKVFSLYLNMQSRKQVSFPADGAARKQSHPQKDDPLVRLSLMTDLQTASYDLCRPPYLSNLEILTQGNYDVSSADPTELHIPHAILLQTCYRFAHQASRYKYIHSSLVPSDLVIEVGRYTGQVYSWLMALDERIDAISHDDRAHYDLRTLRMQALSVLIYLGTRLGAYEVAYDAYITMFRRIVDDARAVMHHEKVDPLTHFRVLAPFSQSLFLTVLKCRHPEIRRSAIDLLANTGIAGPWNGGVAAALGRRVVEIEESGQYDSEGISSCTETAWLSKLAPESTRIHGCGWFGVNGGLGAQFSGEFSQCMNVQIMVDSTRHQKSSPSTKEEAWEEASHWNIWTEQMSAKVNTL